MAPARWGTMRCGTTRIGRILAVFGLLIIVAALPSKVAWAQPVQITPRLDCVEPLPPTSDGSPQEWAYFGYVNINPGTYIIPLGSNNSFVQFPLDRGQPTSFLTGDHYNVFSVDYDPSKGLTWGLDGPGYADATDTNAPRCATGVFATAEHLSLAATVGGSATDTIAVSNPAPPGQPIGPPSALMVGAPAGLTAPLSVSPATGFTVPAPPSMATQQITITCSPTDTSTSTQTLTMTTSDIARPTVSYIIACTGYVPAGGGGGGGTGNTTPELPSGGLLGVGMVVLVVVRRWLRRHSLMA